MEALSQQLSESKYARLVEDCRSILIEEKRLWLNILERKHALGHRIQREYETADFGSHVITQLSKDLGISETELRSCIKFAEKHPDFQRWMEENIKALSNPYQVVDTLTWRSLVKTFYAPRPQTAFEQAVSQDVESWSCHCGAKYRIDWLNHKISRTG